MTLGEKIRNARKNAGFTQEQMAEKLMISRPAITKWEANKGIPDVENLKAISKLLDAVVMRLMPQKRLKKSEIIIDNLIGFLTDASFGIPDMINTTKMLDKRFYLVEKENCQYLVTVDNEFIESRHIHIKAVKSEKSFQIGEMKFTNCGEI